MSCAWRPWQHQVLRATVCICMVLTLAVNSHYRVNAENAAAAWRERAVASEEASREIHVLKTRANQGVTESRAQAHHANMLLSTERAHALLSAERSRLNEAQASIKRLQHDNSTSVSELALLRKLVNDARADHASLGKQLLQERERTLAAMEQLQHAHKERSAQLTLFKRIREAVKIAHGHLDAIHDDVAIASASKTDQTPQLETPPSDGYVNQKTSTQKRSNQKKWTRAGNEVKPTISGSGANSVPSLSPLAPHVPLDASVALEMGHPRCLFVTGGPRTYLHGINCINRRLDVLGSHFPLLTMVEPEDEAYMRAHVGVNSHPQSRLMPWRRFPDRRNRTESWRFRSPHVMDKMNLLGMPFQRVVWIDADIFVARNIDELCALPEDVRFASAVDHQPKNYGKGVVSSPGHCWSASGKDFAAKFSCSAQHCPRFANISTSPYGRPYVGLRAKSSSKCPYIPNTGVMVLSPLTVNAFNEKVVQPLVQGRISSYDETDQGAFATLVYGKQLFGDSLMRLHPMYNTLARNLRHSEVSWNLSKSIRGALVHFSRESRPWSNIPNEGSYASGPWVSACGVLLCNSVAGAYSRFQKSAGMGAYADIIDKGWERWCKLHNHTANASRNVQSHRDA